MERTSDCKEQSKSNNEQVQNGNGSSDAKISHNVKNTAPKLNLNNKLATALAALDTAFNHQREWTLTLLRLRIFS
jgi:hypothetical protein